MGLLVDYLYIVLLNREAGDRKEKEMFQSGVFNYVDLLDKAADASWLRHQAISNNITNATTPGYKRQEVAFESVLQKALGSSRYVPTDFKVSRALNYSLSPRLFQDFSSYSYRLDKNNVDIETEEVMLAENQLKYNGLLDSINDEFSNMQVAMK